MNQEGNWTTADIDEDQIDKNQYFHINSLSRVLYDATLLELTGRFQYIFDLVVPEENKVFIVIIPTEANVIAYYAYLREKGISDVYIAQGFRTDIVYAMKLAFSTDYSLQAIEPDYVLELGTGDCTALLSTFLPQIPYMFNSVWWVEGDGTIGYKSTDPAVDEYAQGFSEYSIFHTLYPNLTASRLFYLFKDNTIKFYYHCPYNEDHALGKAWFTKVAFNGQDPVLYKYISFFNEKRIENTI